MFRPVFVDVDDTLLHVETAGPDDGTPVLFLHGWPDLWSSFLPQMTALARDGYRVIAPDQRGYGLSGKPPNVEDYTVPLITLDSVRLIEKLADGRPVHVVGHDWGGSVAWTLALTHPHLVRSLTVVNCPHPVVFRQALRGPLQWLRSWYMFAFRVPGLGEAVFSFRRGALLALMLRYGAGFSSEEVEAHRRIWRYPGAIGRPIYWYRALRRSFALMDQVLGDGPDGGVPGRIEVPTQLVWGERDFVFSGRQIEASARLCAVEAPIHRFRARHWPHREYPLAVTRVLREWFAAHDAHVSEARVSTVPPC